MAEQDPLCPKCKTKLTPGYGMAGGGMGSYDYCESCDYFKKDHEDVPASDGIDLHAVGRAALQADDDDDWE